MPTPDGGDDPIGVFGPEEGRWIIVVFPDEAVAGGLEIGDRLEDAVSDGAIPASGRSYPAFPR